MRKDDKRPGKIGFLWENMSGLRIVFIISLFGTLVYNTLQLTVPYFSGQITDLFLSGPNAADNLANHRDLLWKLIAGMILITVFRVIVVYLDCMGFEHVSQHALYRIRNTLFEKIEHQDMTFYATYRTGDLMTRLTGDLNAVRHMIAWVLRMILQCSSLFLATFIYFFMMDWLLAVSIVALSPVIFMIVYRFRLKVKPMHVSLREKFANMNTVAQENISGNRVVRAFAREDYEIDKFDDINKDYMETARATDMTWVKYFPAIEACACLLPVILLVVGGLFIISGRITTGEYVSFSGLIWAISNPMRQLGSILNEFQRFSAAADKIMEIWYAEPGIRDPEVPVDHPGRFQGKVEFRDVSFQYSDGTYPVLKHISFTAEPGQTVAIMGETGCGKTSLINLIPRFFDPTEGQVLIDGIDVSTMQLQQLRKNIGLATQDVLLYSDTVEDNIAYGDLNLTEPQVEKYARLSAAARFISHLPEGYATIIGERGTGLSGGQKQRISLARALAIEPSVLILDDTTSAVDLETEKMIQQGLRELDFNCTKLIIAQRISTTRTADKIIILQNGEITESGTHEELIAKKGYYYELVKLQTGLDRELEELIRRTADRAAANGKEAN
ncbi:MAG: ABC transporter ATP-binding protein/permease [Clostridia bacterium]|nr:ABC transporter ATP-binding protein/permease [Clostridia bacterium]